MKYIWEEKDIKAGIMVCKDPSYQGNTEFKPDGNTLKWMLKIGYGWWDNTQHWAIISMIDGCVLENSPYKDTKRLVEYLNSYELIPMPHKWVMLATEELRKNQELY